MKKFIIIIFLLTGVYGIAFGGPHHNAVDSVMRVISQKYVTCQKLVDEGKYDHAIQVAAEANKLYDYLSSMISRQQQNHIDMQVEYEKDERSKAMMRLHNDNLRIQNEILEGKRLKAAENEKEIKKLSEIQRNRQRLILQQQRLNLERLKMRNTQKEMEKAVNTHNAQFKLSMIIAITLLVIALIVFIYFIIMRKMIDSVIAETKKAEEAQKEALRAKEKADVAREAALKAEGMKTAFIQNMSHEIRTPLNAIVGFGEMLADKGMNLSSQEKSEFSKLIEYNSEMLTTLINDLLDLPELLSGKYKLNLSDASAKDICGVVTKMVAQRVPSGVMFVKDEPGYDIPLHTDKERVVQVLVNFCTNACKYTSHGSITLKYEMVAKERDNLPDMVRFSVTDTGTGIPSEKADTIFRRFEKLDEFKQGNGLGLNICRTIADILNGRCWLDTSYQGGARFYFEIPIVCRMLS
jgi:signal transduction histidine kinase